MVKTTKKTDKPSKTMKQTATRVAKVKAKAKTAAISQLEKASEKSLSKGVVPGSSKFVYSSKILKSDEEVRLRDGYTEKIPKKDKHGVIIFKDAKEFRPNMSPKEVLQAGSFGGTYFRPIYSSVTKTSYDKMWNCLQIGWMV